MMQSDITCAAVAHECIQVTVCMYVLFPVSPQGMMMSAWHDITRFRLGLIFITTAAIPVDPTNDRDAYNSVYRYMTTYGWLQRPLQMSDSY
jgi:hypothetical protein